MGKLTSFDTIKLLMGFSLTTVMIVAIFNSRYLDVLSTVRPSNSQFLQWPRAIWAVFQNTKPLMVLYIVDNHFPI